MLAATVPACLVVALRGPVLACPCRRTGRDHAVTTTHHRPDRVHEPVVVRLDQVPRRALAAVMLAILLWTSNFFFVRHADDVLAFSSWRMLLAIPVLGATAAAVRFRSTAEVAAPRLPLTPAIRLAVVGIGALFGISAYVNFLAVNETTLVNVGVIHALQPAVVALVAGRYLAEVVDWRLLARTGIAVAGAVLVAAASMGEGSWSLHGDLLAVVGLGLNTVWFLCGRWVRTRTDLDATSYMFAVFSAGAAVLLATIVVAGRPFTISAVTIGYAALTALMGTIGHTLVAWAHRYVPAAVSSMFLLSQPALIAVLAWVAFGESLGVLHVVGGALVLASLAAVVRHSRGEAAASAVAEAAADLPDVAELHAGDGRR